MRCDGEQFLSWSSHVLWSEDIVFESVLILPIPLEKVDFLVSCQITLRVISFNRGDRYHVLSIITYD